MQTGEQIGVLDNDTKKRIVADITESLTNPQSEEFNPSLAATLQIWTELKKRQDGNDTVNAIVDLVRANQLPLHRVFPQSVKNFFTKLDTVRPGGDGDGGYMGQQQRQQQPQYEHVGSTYKH